ncbi:MAG: pyruvate formate lyase family protein, partial [Clostridia bacterium]|nr:pyruvate formate lyase family protein [Clostridia bacterium]
MNKNIWLPISERTARLRDKYRNTIPAVCSARLNIVTEYYKKHLGEPGLVLRSGRLYDLCEKMPLTIQDDEILVANLTTMYRGSALYPEGGGIGWLGEELRNGVFKARTLDAYTITPEVEADVFAAEEFWNLHCSSHAVDAACMDGFWDIAGNGVLRHRGKGMHGGPVGHFAVNYAKAVDVGFAAVGKEAREKMAALEGKLFGDNAGKYHFYKAVAKCCDAAILYAKRYAKLVEETAEKETNEARKKELLVMADGLNNIFENPCRSFLEATQAVLLLQMLLSLDDNLHGLTLGRLDQALGKYYEADLAAGKITPEYGQEIMDQFFLKICEVNKVKPDRITMSVGGYTSGQIATLGGVDKDGNDATNAVSYMMLQSAGRLVLHEPPLALRVHKNTPNDLMQLAVESNKQCAGVPTFENDDVIIPALLDLGHSIESARNYCIIGCVEPSGCGDTWPAPGGSSGESYFNIANTLLLAINDGVNPLPTPNGKPAKRTGLATGKLYEMNSFEEVKDAFRKQLEFFVDWQ